MVISIDAGKAFDKIQHQCMLFVFLEFPSSTHVWFYMNVRFNWSSSQKTGVFIGTALNLYILLGTITVYAMALHPFQDEKIPFSSTVLIIFACLLSLFLSIYLLAVVNIIFSL